MKENKQEWFLSLAKLVRWPNLVIIFFTQYVVYFFLAKNSMPNHSIFLPPFGLLILSLGTVLVAAAGYVINDYYDIKIDLVNKPERIVIGRVVSRRQALIFHSVLNFLAIAIGFMLSWRVALLYAVCAFLLWFYSNILKRTPLLGNILISVLSAAVVWAVGVYFGKYNRLVYMYAVFAFCISLLREIIKDMEDTKGDAAYGCKTLPIVWGIRKTKTLLIAIMAVFVVLLIYQAILLHTKEIAIYGVIVLCLSYLGVQIMKADKQKDFSDLSLFCKWLMLIGVLSLGFVGQT
jgi:4-hydroxybenzoate polyprenyltransferase